MSRGSATAEIDAVHPVTGLPVAQTGKEVLPNQALKPTVPASGGHGGLA